MVTGVDYSTATHYLQASKWHVKTALIMIIANVTVHEARRRLKAADGFVRRALELNVKK